QPITSAPLWLAHPLGGIQLLFGTGQNLQASDAGDEQVQSIYSVWDSSGFALPDGQLTLLDSDPIEARDARQVLVKQEILGTLAATGQTDPDEREPTYSSERAVAYSRGGGATPRGWYLDVPADRE